MDSGLTRQQENVRKRLKFSPGATSLSEHGKVPPQAVDLEEAVLGAIMLEKDALTSVIDILKPEVFYKDTHQTIYSAIVRLFARSEPVDILTVTNELKSSGELDSIGGAYTVTMMTNRVASAANVEYHVRILIQKYIQRELIRLSSEIIKEAFEDTTDVFDLLDKAEQYLFSVSENNLRRNYEDMQSLVRDAIKEIEAARASEEHLRGVPSGFTSLDRVTAGFQKSDLIILASRPGMGKTAFVLTIARNVAIQFRKPVAVFSLEMSSIQLVTRLISAETLLSSEKLRKGSLENYEWEQLNAKIKELIDAKLYIDDTPALSIFELRAKCRRLKAQHDIQLVVIDYLQLMVGQTDKQGNREQEISNISRSLKALAKELNVPIIALSQLSRAVETRGGSKKPVLSDLRESGAIEQDADLVMFIYRPEYYNIDQDEEGNSTAGQAIINIAKHRNGSLADIQLRFVGKYAKFEDPEKESLSSFSIDESAGIKTIPSRMNDMEDEEDFPF
ncbi:MAG: replicative DNA helicase [Bacteroidetes bacterium]|nr:replicative DNA helicase [Bacteroidota bacterium]